MPQQNSRRADLAKIHLAKKQLGMDDQAYRDVMFAVCQVRSAGELSMEGRAKLLAHFEKCGFKVTGKARAERFDGKTRKIVALWCALRAKGVLRDSSDAALESYIERMTGVRKAVFLTGAQQDLVIESLKAWGHREKAEVF